MTFEQLRGTIQAHDVRFESCDRDGQEFCDCLERAVDQLEATVATKPFTPDWSLLEATQASLREHMAIAKAAQESERAFREQVAVALGELRAELVALIGSKLEAICSIQDLVGKTWDGGGYAGEIYYRMKFAELRGDKILASVKVDFPYGGHDSGFAIVTCDGFGYEHKYFDTKVEAEKALPAKF